MAGEGRGPTLRAQWLGRQLRELREMNGKTLQDAADFLQRSPSTVSRFESAEYPIRRPDVLALLDLYQVSDSARRENLLRLSQDVWQRGWWEGFADVIGDDQPIFDIVWLETRATRIRGLHVALLPGLLQTEGYAAEVIRRWDPTATEETIAQQVELRLNRRQILTREEPVRYEVVLDEAALRRPVGGPAVHREQLRHLVEMAAGDTMELMVLPFGLGWHPGLESSFSIFSTPPAFPDVGYADTPAGALFIEGDRVEHLNVIFDVARGLANDPERSVNLIKNLMEEFGS